MAMTRQLDRVPGFEPGGRRFDSGVDYYVPSYNVKQSARHVHD